MTPDALHALFARERARFARHWPAVADVPLCVAEAPCSPESPCGFRDVAWADIEAGVVVIVARALRWPVRNLVAVLRHEIGHLVDPWPDAPHWEQRADDIAAAVTGQRIRYDRFDRQTLGPGRWPRPLHLHA